MCSALSVSHNLTKVTQPWLVLLQPERINSEITHSVPVVAFCCCYCWKSENICEHSCVYNSRAWITTAMVCLGLFWHQLKCSGLQHLFICLTLVLNFQKKPPISIQSLSCFSENQHHWGFREYTGTGKISMLAWISLNSRCHPLWQANSQTETKYPKSARMLQWNNLDKDGFTVQTPKALLEIKIEVILNRSWEKQDLYTQASPLHRAKKWKLRAIPSFPKILHTFSCWCVAVLLFLPAVARKPRDVCWNPERNNY